MEYLEIRQINGGDLVEIEVQKNGKIMQFSSTVVRIMEQVVLITLIQVNGKAVGFPEELKTRFICKAEGKPFVWENPVLKPVKYEGVLYHMAALSGQGIYTNRRQAFRQYIGEEMPLTVPAPVTGKEIINVLVRDISETGAGFLTSRELKEGDAVKLRIKKNNYIINLNARVVRIQCSEALKHTIYGCRFTDIVPKLSQYIMEIQRERLKKSRMVGSEHRLVN